LEIFDSINEYPSSHVEPLISEISKRYQELVSNLQNEITSVNEDLNLKLKTDEEYKGIKYTKVEECLVFL
jgi:hypothetical protein